MAATKSTTSWIDKNLSPGVLLLNGILLLVLNLLAEQITDKMVVFCFLVVLNLFRKKQLKPLTHAFFILILVLINLYPPYGKLLFTILTFPITAGALVNGLGKGLTLVSFIYIARFSISNSLKLPGTIGRLITRTLYYLDLMQQEQKNLGKSGIVRKIDQLILNLWERGDTIIIDKTNKSTVKGIIFIFINVLSIIILLYFV